MDNLVEAPGLIALSRLTEEELRAIAAGDTSAVASRPVAKAALPPAHVAARALHQLAGGCPAEWALPFHIVDVASGQVVGGCTFKGLPREGAVEIGYGIAPSCQGRGYASEAVRRLLAMAAASGTVSELYALIAPDNAASAAVVAKAGFIQGPALVDHDGEHVVRWQVRCA